MADKYHEELMLYASAAAAVILLDEDEEMEVRKRKCWVKKWRNSRDRLGNYHKLMRELRNYQSKDFNNFVGLDETGFNRILSKIKNDIKKQDTLMREAVPAKERLAVTLRYLFTGEHFENLEYTTKLSSSFLRISVLEVCEAIYKNMKNEYLKFPPTIEEWTKIADDFEHVWQFPLCIGALDVNHIAIQTTKKNAPLYANINGYTSIALLGLVDAYGRFIFIDIGCAGSVSDEGVLNHSNLMSVLRNTDKYLPSRKVIGNDRFLPHVIIADDGFPLQDHIMTPYSSESREEWKHNFNNRLNCARQNVLQSFEMLFKRFKILQRTIKLSEQKLKTIVQCCCVLHNYLINNNNGYSIDIDTDNHETSSNSNISRKNFNTRSYSRYSESSNEIRQAFAEYFSNEGTLK